MKILSILLASSLLVVAADAFANDFNPKRVQIGSGAEQTAGHFQSGTVRDHLNLLQRAVKRHGD